MSRQRGWYRAEHGQESAADQRFRPAGEVGDQAGHQRTQWLHPLAAPSRDRRHHGVRDRRGAYPGQGQHEPRSIGGQVWISRYARSVAARRPRQWPIATMSAASWARSSHGAPAAACAQSSSVADPVAASAAALSARISRWTKASPAVHRAQSVTTSAARYAYAASHSSTGPAATARSQPSKSKIRSATGRSPSGARCPLAVRHASTTIDASAHGPPAAPVAQVVTSAAHGPHSTVARRRGAGTDSSSTSRTAERPRCSVSTVTA
jgi:hypothetical protein